MFGGGQGGVGYAVILQSVWFVLGVRCMLVGQRGCLPGAGDVPEGARCVVLGACEQAGYGDLFVLTPCSLASPVSSLHRTVPLCKYVLVGLVLESECRDRAYYS